MNKQELVIQDQDKLIATCPHCQDLIIILKQELNCCIFRHAVLKENMTQINPHESKEVCDSLVTNNKVFGCAKPFRIISRDNNYFIESCEYI